MADCLWRKSDASVCWLVAGSGLDCAGQEDMLPVRTSTVRIPMHPVSHSAALSAWLPLLPRPERSCGEDRHGRLMRNAARVERETLRANWQWWYDIMRGEWTVLGEWRWCGRCGKKLYYPMRLWPIGDGVPEPVNDAKCIGDRP